MKHFPRWIRLLTSRYHYVVGISLRYVGNAYGITSAYEKAVMAFSSAIGASSDYARAYLNRGILYWRELDNPDQAIRDLTTAYDLDPSLAEARFNRAIAYQQLRDFDAALADFRAYLSEGDHPYWREYAESMLLEIRE